MEFFDEDEGYLEKRSKLIADLRKKINARRRSSFTFAADTNSGPIITAGPTWINNQDGTSTITWTTDQATDSKVSYGATSSYGSTATDGASTTSHSVSITPTADGVYHFAVSDTSDTYTSDDGLLYVDSAEIGHFYIFPHQNDTTFPHIFAVSNQDQSANGISYAMQTVSPGPGGTIRCLTGAYEGAMYPGVMFDFTPDVTSGSVGSSTNAPFRYKNMGTVGAYIGWTVPAWVTAANGFNNGEINTLLIVCDGAGSGHVEVHRIRSAVDTTIAADVTPAGSGYFSAEVDISAAPLLAGDTVYVRTIAGGGTEAIVGCVMGYSSSGTFPNTVAHRIMNKTAQIQMRQNPGTPTIWNDGGSSAENAVEIAPNGSALKFVGGAAHQDGSTYGAEYPATEVWTKNGEAWTPAQGYYRAKLQMVRTSTCYYSAGSPNIGTMVTTYKGEAAGLSINTELTYNVALDTGSLYAPMLPLKAAFATAANTLDGSSNETVALASLPKTWAAQAAAVTWAYGTSIVAGVGVYQTAGAGSSVYDNRFLANNKNYQRLSPVTATNAAVNTVKRGVARYFSLPAAGPVAPTLSATSCTVSADGRTILVVPVTKTGGITGSTGLTFKRGGSSISSGQSITNNADGTITVLLTVANKVLSSDTITVDVATASLYDAFGIMMVAANTIAVVNESTQ